MSLELPLPIAYYFVADQGDGEAVALCFTENAIVKDEDQTYRGRAAIKQWKANSSAQYHYTSAPFNLQTEGDTIVVTSHLVGDFPGSPVDLRYFFVLESEKIASLEIIP